MLSRVLRRTLNISFISPYVRFPVFKFLTNTRMYGLVTVSVFILVGYFFSECFPHRARKEYEMSWKYYFKFIEKTIEVVAGAEEILLDVLFTRIFCVM